MSEQGMMKWAAYKSLDEQADYLKNSYADKKKTAKPSVASEKAEEINQILSLYHGEEILLHCWKQGIVYSIKGFINKIDIIYKVIKVNGMSIDINSIVDLRQL
jgi:hypothetical protein